MKNQDDIEGISGRYNESKETKNPFEDKGALPENHNYFLFCLLN